MESMVVLMKTNAEIKDDPDAVDAAEIVDEYAANPNGSAVSGICESVISTQIYCELFGKSP